MGSLINSYLISLKINKIGGTGLGEIIRGGPYVPGMMPQIGEKTNHLGRKKERKTTR